VLHGYGSRKRSNECCRWCSEDRWKYSARAQCEPFLQNDVRLTDLVLEIIEFDEMKLCATAMKKDPLTLTRAKTYLEKALKIDNSFLPALLTFVDILESVSLHSVHRYQFRRKQNSFRRPRVEYVYRKGNTTRGYK